MSSCCFMYQNLVTATEQVRLSSAQAGVVGMPAPRARGSAVAYAAGEYQGAADQVFLVEIDSVAAGRQVGQATFRWQRGSAGAWEQTGVTTGDSLTALADGVSLKWLSGSGDDFALGDAWSILAVRSHGPAALLDRDRDQQWISTGAADEHLTVDLGQPRRVGAVILADHNLSDAAVVTLMANPSDAWSAPAYSQALSLTRPHLVSFPERSYRYWRLRLQDPANQEGVLKASGLFLGPRFCPSRTFRAGYSRATLAGRRVTTTDAGKMAGHTRGLADNLAVEFRGLDQDDADAFRAMFQAIHDPDSGRLAPVFFTPFDHRPGDTLYCLPGPSLALSQTHHDRWALKLNLEEVVRTHV